MPPQLRLQSISPLPNRHTQFGFKPAGELLHPVRAFAFSLCSIFAPPAVLGLQQRVILDAEVDQPAVVFGQYGVLLR